MLDSKKRFEGPSVLFITLLFVLTRSFYFFFMGVRFDAGPLPFYWQYLDPQLLQNNLLESLMNLHSQPPLFNAYLGIVLKLSGKFANYVFHIVSMLLGLITVIFLFLTLRALQISRQVSIFLSAVTVIMPTNILYENWLFYTHMVSAIVTTSTFFLVKTLRRPASKNSFFLFSSLATLSLLRAPFHISWFLICCILVVFACPFARKQLLKNILFPLLLLLFVYLNNYLKFEVLSLSEVFANSNLAAIPAKILSPTEIADSVANGRVPPASLIPINSPLKVYLDRMPNFKKQPPVGIHALDEEFRSTGAVNTNNIAYIKIYRELAEVGQGIMLKYPQAYLRFVGRNFYEYLSPASFANPPPGGGHNQQKLSWLINVSNTLICGRIGDRGPAYFLWFFIPTIFLTSLCFVVTGYKKDQIAMACTSAYMLLTLLFCCSGFILLAWGDQARTRAEVDSLFVIGFGILIDWVYRKFFGLRRGRCREVQDALSVRVSRSRIGSTDS